MFGINVYISGPCQLYLGGVQKDRLNKRDIKPANCKMNYENGALINGVACSMHERDENYAQYIVGNTERKHYFEDIDRRIM